SVTAGYGGDSNFAASAGSLTGGETVAKAGTSTAITASVNPAVFGQGVAFRATITVTAPGSGTPTGTVQFIIDGATAGSPVSVSTSGGLTTALFTSSLLGVGTHTVTASYSGDGSFVGSNAALTGGESVNKANTSTAVSSSVNPSVPGQAVTFTATINITSPGGGTPSGTVQFQIDGSSAGSPVNVSTSGGVTTASLSTASLAGGTHSITASYSGDSSFTGSSGTLSGGQVVSQAATIADGTILVASSPLSGQPSAPAGIIGVNPSTGAQSLIATGAPFVFPVYVREAASGQLYVADYSATGKGAIIRIDPTTLQASVFASGGNINAPVSLAIINGLLYVADSAGTPNLVEINLTTGQQRLVASGGNFSAPVGLAAAPNNGIYWADEYAF